MQLSDEPGLLTLEDQQAISERLRPIVDNLTELPFSEMDAQAIARAVSAVARTRPSLISVENVADAYRLLQHAQAWLSATRAGLLTAFDRIDNPNDSVASEATGLDRSGRRELAQAIRDREDNLRRNEQIARGIIKN